MTNEQIIFEARLDALKNGLIGTTGRMITVEIGGEKKSIPEPEDMHTFVGWKALGFSVKRGETSKATVYLWKMKKLSKAEKEALEALGTDPEDDDDHFIKVKSYLFSTSQVHPTDDGPDGKKKGRKARKESGKAAAPKTGAAPVTAPAASVPAASTDLHIRIGAHDQMTIRMNAFFPCNHPQLAQLMQIIREDEQHADELKDAIVRHLLERMDKINTDYCTKAERKQKEGYKRNLAWLGVEVTEAENPVRFSGKKEFYEIVKTAAGRGSVRETKQGYRVTYLGNTFFATKSCKLWTITEARSGLKICDGSTKDAAAEQLALRWTPDLLRKVDFDQLEKEKLAAPLEVIAA